VPIFTRVQVWLAPYLDNSAPVWFLSMVPQLIWLNLHPSVGISLQLSNYLNINVSHSEAVLSADGSCW